MHIYFTKLFIHVLLLLITVLFTGCSIKPNNAVPKEYQLGQISYHRVCAQCHGADAMGDKRAPTFLQKKFLSTNFSNSRIVRTKINGSDSGAMPSQKRRVKDEEIGEIIKYIRYSQKRTGVIS